MTSMSLGHAVLGVVLFLLALFAVPFIGILAGAFCGAVVGFFFPGTVGLVGSAIAGGAIIPAWQVGAILGFVGGFFKTSLRTAFTTK